MALLPILQYPDPRLYTKAASVEVFDEALRRLAADMAETMYAAPGVGLAATQVDVHKRLIVIDVSEDKRQLRVLVNPRIVQSDGAQTCDEGCLSVPGVYEPVERAERVRVEAQDLEGKAFSFDADGLLAVCVQHEMDHLEGKVFVDYLSRLKQSRIRARMQKQQRKSA